MEEEKHIFKLKYIVKTIRNVNKKLFLFGKHKSILYFHNLKYDFVASLRKNVVCSNPVIKDNTIYKVEIKHYGYTIELRDSYKLISSPLRDFQKMAVEVQYLH